jgi:hypothetical protein
MREDEKDFWGRVLDRVFSRCGSIEIAVRSANGALLARRKWEQSNGAVSLGISG